MSELNSFLCNVLDDALSTFDEDKGLYTFDDDFEEREDSSSSTLAGDDLLPFYDIANAPTITTAGPPPATTTSSSSSTLKRQQKAPSKKRKQQSSEMEKPRRPLSAYNLFFRYERDSIVSGKDPDRIILLPTVSPEEKIAHIREITMNSVALETSTKRKRRTNRKAQAPDQISFGDLAKMIAEKWKTVEPEHASLFEKLSSMDKDRYKKELQDWNERRMNKNTKRSTAGCSVSSSQPKTTERKRENNNMSRPPAPSSCSFSQPNKKIKVSRSSIPQHSNMSAIPTSCVSKATTPNVATPICHQQQIPFPFFPAYFAQHHVPQWHPVPQCHAHHHGCHAQMPVPWTYQFAPQKPSPQMQRSHSCESLHHHDWAAQASFPCSSACMTNTFDMDDDISIHDEFERFMETFDS